jgi:hypothetical protein
MAEQECSVVLEAILRSQIIAVEGKILSHLLTET